ncbi:uncharacterized protein LOC111305179 [Durio zibethinus]|uniref:Uncharacterized protein LOC111305179 n=1 Tax=Durio zibethinus TaxID=66656 RepID=A0A6P6A0C7_DURZI|nr:uncharacterized protein LOC111305179 [Durio zibethinus]
MLGSSALSSYLNQWVLMPVTQPGANICQPPHICFTRIFNCFPSYKRASKSSTAFQSPKQNSDYMHILPKKKFSVRSMKGRSWQRCSKQIREQRARLYIIWRCTVLLLCWHD